MTAKTPNKSSYLSIQPVLDQLPMFQYRSVPFSHPLYNIVLRYWYVNSKMLSGFVFPTFPDCCPDILFCYRNGTLFNVAIGSAMYKLEMTTIDAFDQFGVTLFPGVYSALFDEKAAGQIARTNMDITARQSSVLNPLINEMKSAYTFEDRISCCNRFFIPRAKEIKTFIKPITQLTTTCTGMTIEEYCRNIGYSTRQLQRIVTSLADTSPKQLLSMKQFLDSYQEIMLYPHKSLQDIAFDGNYYDYSHMRRAFIKMSDMPPNKLLEFCESYTESIIETYNIAITENNSSEPD